MLLFIFSETTGLSKKASFNTSHVTLYRNVQNSADSGEIVSIHHMLLFIDSTDTQKFAFLLFQYITCYSLSNTTQGSNITGLCFNTSHVTLYQDDEKKFLKMFKFQYITCYSLSIAGESCVHHILEFQYITCYSLSLYSPFVRFSEIGFNTSHVTLYHGGRDR